MDNKFSKLSSVDNFDQACRYFALRVIALIIGSIFFVVGLPVWVAQNFALVSYLLCVILWAISTPGRIFFKPLEQASNDIDKYLVNFFDKYIHILVRHKGFENRGKCDRMWRYFAYYVSNLGFGSYMLVVLSGLGLPLCLGVTAMCMLLVYLCVLSPAILCLQCYLYCRGKDLIRPRQVMQKIGDFYFKLDYSGPPGFNDETNESVILKLEKFFKKDIYIPVWHDQLTFLGMPKSWRATIFNW